MADQVQVRRGQVCLVMSKTCALRMRKAVLKAESVFGGARYAPTSLSELYLRLSKAITDATKEAQSNG